MSDIDESLSSFNKKMQNSVDALIKAFLGLRTNRASTGLLDTIMVEAYGNTVPIQQIGTISVPEARMLIVQVWDKNIVKSVEKAIRDADLGLNPAVDGQMIRIPMPPLSAERRQELSKIAAKYCEETKIAIRNIRRDALEVLKKQEKDKEITEDDLHIFSDSVQKMTDSHIKEVEEALARKQQDIMSV